MTPVTMSKYVRDLCGVLQHGAITLISYVAAYFYFICNPLVAFVTLFEAIWRGRLPSF